MRLYLAGLDAEHLRHPFENRNYDDRIYCNCLMSYHYQKKKADIYIKDRKEIMKLFLAGADKFGIEEAKKYMKLYLAGVSETDKPPIDSNALFSYYFQQKQNVVDKLKDYIKPGKLFIDSGAFSAFTKGVKIDVDSYIDWINERTDDITVYGQLDIIPATLSSEVGLTVYEESARKTWENYLYMHLKMKEPEKLLYTFHVGEPIKYLKQALEWTDENGNHISYIALGGMVGKPRAIRRAFLENCFNAIKKSSNPDVKVHAFGMTDFEILEEFPIYSADSTSWIMVGAMGNIMTDFGNIAVSENQKNDKNHFSHLSKESIEDFNKMIGKYGFTLEELSVSRNKRIMFNAMYMIERASKIDNRKKILSRRKLF